MVRPVFDESKALDFPFMSAFEITPEKKTAAIVYYTTELSVRPTIGVRLLLLAPILQSIRMRPDKTGFWHADTTNPAFTKCIDGPPESPFRSILQFIKPLREGVFDYFEVIGLQDMRG